MEAGGPASAALPWTALRWGELHGVTCASNAANLSVFSKLMTFPASATALQQHNSVQGHSMSWQQQLQCTTHQPDGFPDAAMTLELLAVDWLSMSGRLPLSKWSVPGTIGVRLSWREVVRLLQGSLLQHQPALHVLCMQHVVCTVLLWRGP